MKLPHLEPILFAKEVLFCDENIAKVRCVFSSLPTLAMMVEASAQASSAFSTSSSVDIGFLVLVKDTVLLKKSDQLSFVVCVSKGISLGNSREFYFEVFEEEVCIKKIASGAFMLVLKET
ncbi:MAG: hypothetical protein PHW07_00625 [Sulfurospirillaceae bacterium]|nr:hypothetical protein [Sulfurospirillaceae bacterium]